ncbi:hypothetical protein [Dyella sp. ASV21]|uniref:hypothetical protein n=1 Tax=Dyella sp. ASV21 TaxID=2795114 RepID=UPI0018ECCA0E|nr:hypothetical protein [Dyella sp. ASV21]
MCAPDELREFSRQLCDALPAPFKRTMAGQFEQISAAHRSNTGANAFLYGQDVYFDTGVVLPITRVKGKPQSLAPELLPTFLAWLKPTKEMQADLDRIRQVLGSIVMRAKSWQDVRDMLPDRLLAFSTSTHIDLPRTTPDLQEAAKQGGEPIWNASLTRLYAQVGDIIDLYLGYKLL